MQKKLVIKIGSSTLTKASNAINFEFILSLSSQINELRNMGYSPIIVTSAAIACGLDALGIKERPSDMPSLQACASVGQNILSAHYAKAFSRYNMLSSIVLLTRRETADRTTYLNARETLNKLCEFGVVPIINENDAISIEQIKFGDNDTLAALVACLVDASELIVLSDICGLYDKNPNLYKNAKLIKSVSEITPDILSGAGDAISTVGSGGMISKVVAARTTMAANIPMTICHGTQENVLLSVVNKEDIDCTRFVPKNACHEVNPKKLWIALGNSTKGKLTVDEGACAAIIQHGASLLAVGVLSACGDFEEDDIVDVESPQHYVIARGKIAFSSDEVKLALGKSSDYLASNKLLSPLSNRPLIHRDDLVVF